MASPWASYIPDPRPAPGKATTRLLVTVGGDALWTVLADIPGDHGYRAREALKLAVGLGLDAVERAEAEAPDP